LASSFYFFFLTMRGGYSSLFSLPDGVLKIFKIKKYLFFVLWDYFSTNLISLKVSDIMRTVSHILPYVFFNIPYIHAIYLEFIYNSIINNSLKKIWANYYISVLFSTRNDQIDMEVFCWVFSYYLGIRRLISS